MKSELEFSWNQTKESADRIFAQNTGKYLSDIEMKVLQGSWEGKSYDEIATTYGYSAEYLNKDVGNKLWHKLSEALGEKITKKNFKEALRRASESECSQSVQTNPPLQTLPTAVNLQFPEGSVALDSPFYIKRSNIESLCNETVLKPGSLIRIKAPEMMGKTSLMNRILAHAKLEKYHAVYLDLSAADRGILTNLDKFLRWLCLMVSRQLKLENKLNEYWDTDILGSNDNCTVYFEEYLLAEIETPLVLGLDEVDRLFGYTEVVEDFLGMLRSWHEKAKISDIWQKLRLVMAHSTEVYIPLDMNQSPFNAGVPVELQEFDSQKIHDLARLHGLDWDEGQLGELICAIGGHPYLVRLAMYEISCGNITLTQLLKNAASESGIYSNHLRKHLEILQHNPELALALKKVVNSAEPVELDSMQIYKLHSMGIVRRQNNYVLPRCNLYREYFCRVLG
ncbi:MULTISPECIES: AAA-like domain-containing protein [unclassified Microcoleus]|uniref:AAA-like domain-containing protein n=1 Tax=unclassified Microcoleus TaxID=2642155 RepID=UPI001D7084D2|nr:MULTISPECIES: AAA-like domain-containing protein [unclassified Microcoleus]MCC3472074.1 AAA-like domain-containing protein [Microcoleus sp. PH2017_13_LAR_U_A]MCC3484620.1 AAA-like domain-containing protein [Microcoleus sp. PH2017_14_LAR_D_A]MCC3597189.1 AAA-like domain-containing protein [Microcoleus sp. PH2017_26_ELK_O_A]MCC3622124.1 AAA-like domain-containing protein [Microcoleus sp. PH2017_36_ELK_O_B]